MKLPQCGTPAKILTITKESAARTQLKTAIKLWFDYGDPISIHALAVAANDCYRAMAAHARVPSIMAIWTKSLPPHLREQILEVQNFIKHGWKNLKGQVRYPVIHGEILIVDSIKCHRRIFGTATPLMEAFVAVFGFMNPHLLSDSGREIHAALTEVEKLRNLTRGEFLQIALQTFKSSGAER